MSDDLAVDFWTTNAPTAYDYEYTVRIGDLEGGVRMVAIPIRFEQYQTDRYLSGMYFATRIV